MFGRHAREGGHPGFLVVLWIPAYAGMTSQDSAGMRAEL